MQCHLCKIESQQCDDRCSQAPYPDAITFTVSIQRQGFARVYGRQLLHAVDRLN